ncbi:hypothetical protein LTR53_011144 [Teratosphaeriaceae sp. CCFEE 6253]|nr:hypothetical protein LTR53_011144 [Teratosphaeriaceae sp. CCFEE 6253]
MASCVSRFSCHRLSTDDNSPSKPCRQPRYTLSRVPSLETCKHDSPGLQHTRPQASESSSSSTRTVQTVIRKQAHHGSQGVVRSSAAPRLRAEKRDSSLQVLVRRAQTLLVKRRASTGADDVLQCEVMSARTATPSLRRRPHVADLRDRYFLPDVVLGHKSSVRWSVVGTEDGDSEWMTDDGDEDERGMAAR